MLERGSLKVEARLHRDLEMAVEEVGPEFFHRCLRGVIFGLFVKEVNSIYGRKWMFMVIVSTSLQEDSAKLTGCHFDVVLLFWDFYLPPRPAKSSSAVMWPMSIVRRRRWHGVRMRCGSNGCSKFQVLTFWTYKIQSH